MSASVDSTLLERVSEYLLSLPYDLKILQEAITDPDLDKSVRLVAAGAVLPTLLPQAGEPGPPRYAADVLSVRGALAEVGRGDREGAAGCRGRFAAEVYSRIDEDVKLFSSYLGAIWPWLTGKLTGFQKLALKGKKATQA